MRRRMKLLVLVLGFALAACSDPATAQDPTPGYTVVRTFPHDENAFTQGLAFWEGRFFEGTGIEGRSTLREVDLETGDVLRSRALAPHLFGEGITILDRRIYQLTWQDHVAFVYRPGNFNRVIRRFRYGTEGWGLTTNGKRLIMSDGTNVIRFRDPRTFRVKRKLRVTRNGEPVQELNELEWIQGEIFANVFRTDFVVRIDPRTGEVVDRIDLSTLRQMEEADPMGDPDVTNGIAYWRSQDRLFVTGKLWRNVYEIRLDE
ncbi:MAG: glutaminyl-peptide cyclotransferase [Actinomycetota bacterium]